MFGWFRKHIRKIGIFGVEVEFHPPSQSYESGSRLGGEGVTEASQPAQQRATAADSDMNWEQLLAVLQERVGAGLVTTYGNCSEWAFGHRCGGQSIRAMLEAAARRGHQEWTNRVVFDDGSLGRADEAHGQTSQLRGEGIQFQGEGVDLHRCPPVVL
jgi:alkylated DNA nucleotide flippase Atl1